MSIGSKMAAGAAWMIGFKFIQRGLSIASTIILARLLIPADFGLVAMAMSVVGMLELLSAFSFDIVLVQRQVIQRHHYDTAWTYNVITGAVIAALLLALAGPAAGYYDEPRLSDVISWLAAGALLHGFENIGVVRFQRELEFNKEFAFMLSRRAASFLLTIPLAFVMRSYWALVVGMLGGRVISLVASYLMSEYRPRISFAATRELFGFSAWLLLNNYANFFVLRTSDFVIGRLSGAASLGLYNISNEISNLFTTELAAPINRAVFAGYSKLASDAAALRNAYLSVIGIIGLATVPAGVGVAAIAEPLVLVLLGDTWVDAVPLIQVLSLAGAVRSLGTNIGPAFWALGRPASVTAFTIVRLVILVPLMIWLVRTNGPVGGAFAALIVTSVVTPIQVVVLLFLLDCAVSELIRQFWRPLVGAAVMYVLVRQLLLLASGWFIVLQLAAAVVLGASAYVACVVALWYLSGKPDGAERTVLSKIRSRMPA